MVFAAKWPIKTDVNFWLADGKKAENAFLYNRRVALHLILSNLALVLISAYQKYLRPVLPACCRFEPSCSEYAKQAILKYGLIKGVLKGLIRILHCHPFSRQSGYDPLV